MVVLSQREHLTACLARTRARALVLGTIVVFAVAVGMFTLGLRLGINGEKAAFKKQCTALLNEYCPARAKNAKELQQRLLKAEKKHERKIGKNKGEVK